MPSRCPPGLQNVRSDAPEDVHNQKNRDQSPPLLLQCFHASNAPFIIVSFLLSRLKEGFTTSMFARARKK